MKKVITIMMTVLLLSGCSQGVTSKDLQANDWQINTQEISGESSTPVTVNLSFYEETLDINIDPNDLWQAYVEDNPNDDDEFTKMLFMTQVTPIISQNAPYTLNGDILTVSLTLPFENTQSDINLKLKKQDGNLNATVMSYEEDEMVEHVDENNEPYTFTATPK